MASSRNTATRGDDPPQPGLFLPGRRASAVAAAARRAARPRGDVWLVAAGKISAIRPESARRQNLPGKRNLPGPESARRAGISPGGPESARRAGISQAGRNQPGWTRICQRAVISPAGPNLAGRSGIYWAGQARGKSVTFATSAFEADDRITARQAKAANPGQPFRESRTVWPGHPTATRYSVLTCAPRPEITKGGAQAQSGGRHPRRHLGSPGLAPNPASWRGQPGDPVARILAIERPSPDPPMNRRCSSLDAYCLVSNAERIQLRRRASEGTTFAAESICSG